MTTKMQSSAKFASVKPSPATRSSHEVIRHLRQDLDRYKDENEELRSSITHITQSYLQEKQKVEDLLIKIQSLSSAPANAMRTVDKLVERQLENRQKELLRVVEDQRATIQKYQKYKICLSKNVCDLQDRLKATKQELHQTQKLLFTLQ
jgi:cob(I)alamin adenosyltransferase